MFENGHALSHKKKSLKKSLINSTRNVSAREESNQSLSFFMGFFSLNNPKYFL